MSEFLKEFDEAIAEAKEDGIPVFVWRSYFDDDGNYNLRRVGRTRHPAFMADQAVKHDPKRDRFVSSASLGRVDDIKGQDVA